MGDSINKPTIVTIPAAVGDPRALAAEQAKIAAARDPGLAAKINKITSNLDSIIKEDYGHKSLGDKHEFTACELAYKGTGVTLQFMWWRWLAVQHNLDAPIADASALIFETTTNEMVAEIAKITNLIGRGTKAPEFVEGRNNILNQAGQKTQTWVAKMAPTITQITALENRMVLERITEHLQSAEDVEKIKKTATDMNKLQSEAEKALAAIRADVQALATSKGLSKFSALADQEGKRSNNWALGFGGAGLATIVFAVYSYIEIRLGYAPATIPSLLLRTGMLAILVWLAMVVKKQWDIAQHLQITYQHRTYALEQFSTLEAAIPEGDNKNAMRTEIAKLLLSDPHTGLTGKGGDEVNIGSVVGAAGRAMSGKQ